MTQIKTFSQLLSAEGFKGITDEVNAFLVENPGAELQRFDTVDRHGFAIWYAVVQYDDGTVFVGTPQPITWRDRK